MSMSPSEKRIIEMLRAVGRMRATVAHVIACSGTVDEELTAMAEELETLRCAFPRKPKHLAQVTGDEGGR